MWDLPRPGVEPVSPALAGISFFLFFFFTTEPPGKPQNRRWHLWVEGPEAVKTGRGIEFEKPGVQPAIWCVGSIVGVEGVQWGPAWEGTCIIGVWVFP